MRIDELLTRSDRPSFSFEFFPPKTEEGERNLWNAIAALKPLAPDYVSVTYGAGGSTRDKTLDIVERIRREYGLEAMAHFTCVGATVDELTATLDRMRELGLDNVLALRGDPPQGQETWTKTEGGLEYSRELVELIGARYGEFSVGAACFPETHIHATSPEDDLRHLKAKVDAGVDFLITQLFFDNAFYYDFVDRARAAGVDVPIIPGIMPITNARQIQRVTSLCKSRDPRPPARRARRARRRPGRRGGLRRRLRHAAVRRPARPRRARHPLLHDEPLAGDAGDPQRAEAPAAVGARRRADRGRRRLGRRRAVRRLDLQALRHAGGAVRAHVADVDRVVLAVGREPEGAHEPAPAADAVLAQRAGEDEDAPLHLEVAPLLLAHAVEVDLEGLDDVPRQPDHRSLHRGP